MAATPSQALIKLGSMSKLAERWAGATLGHASPCPGNLEGWMCDHFSYDDDSDNAHDGDNLGMRHVHSVHLD